MLLTGRDLRAPSVLQKRAAACAVQQSAVMLQSEASNPYQISADAATNITSVPAGAIA